MECKKELCIQHLKQFFNLFQHLSCFLAIFCPNINLASKSFYFYVYIMDNAFNSLKQAKIYVILFLDFLMVDQIFLSIQVKQSVVISNKLIYTSCLTSSKTTSDSGSQKIRKYPEKLMPSAQFSFRNENFVSTSKNILKNRN